MSSERPEMWYDDGAPLKPTVRLNVYVNDETAKAVREAMERNDLSATEVIRQAVSLHKFVYDELVGEGKSIQVVDADGTATVLAAVDEHLAAKVEEEQR